MSNEETGGYDQGYKACPCFWGTSPGSLILKLERLLGGFRGLDVLDAGAGEGKNAAYFARQGATVTAIELSPHAIMNAIRAWGKLPGVEFILSDIRTYDLATKYYDVVVAYGLLHCLRNTDEVLQVLDRLSSSVRPGGHLVLCAFNSRYQELDAHPGFEPCLLKHEYYMDLLSSWHVKFASDEDLLERHPHNNILHSHSLTRIIASRPEGCSDVVST